MARSGRGERKRQWQEQPEPQPPEVDPDVVPDAELDSVLVSDFDSVFDSVFESDFASPALALASLPFAASGLLPEFLKSVAYHPLPLSWKPAALTSLLKRLLPQAGHSVSGESDNFCSASSWCPQAAQRYS